MRTTWIIPVCSECGMHGEDKYSLAHTKGCTRIGRHANRAITVVKAPVKPLDIDLTEFEQFLDMAIVNWRKLRDSKESGSDDYAMASYYIDAFQSIRATLFDETLPTD